MSSQPRKPGRLTTSVPSHERSRWRGPLRGASAPLRAVLGSPNKPVNGGASLVDLKGGALTIDCEPAQVDKAEADAPKPTMVREPVT